MPIRLTHCSALLMTLALAACGDAPGIADSPLEEIGAAADEAADKADATWWDVVGDASSAWKHLTQSADSWLNEEPLRQREIKCDQESGEWTESIDVSACRDGIAQVTVLDKTYDQECEGDGPGGTFEFQCLHRGASADTVYFNDGPSVPHAMHKASEYLGDSANTMLWNDVFWEPAVNHDYCYHHGQATYGYDQKDCDGQMLDDLMAICASGAESDAPWFTHDACSTNAHAAFAALRYYGEENFGTMDTRVVYPEYVPMYQKLKLREQPCEPELRDRIERPFN